MNWSQKNLAIVALILVGIAPTASIFATFGTGEGWWGSIAWMATKLWMCGLPFWWLLKIDKGKISWSKPRLGGLGAGFLLGTVFALVMLLAWFFLGEQRVDKEEFRSALAPFGLTNVSTYLAAALFWTAVNSVLEEYVFRWFLVEKGEMIFGSPTVTMCVSAGIFVLHHFFALHFLGFPIALNLLACFGLFIAAVAFSWLYLQYRSIWVPYLTHAMCDVVVFWVGYIILFG